MEVEDPETLLSPSASSSTYGTGNQLPSMHTLEEKYAAMVTKKEVHLIFLFHHSGHATNNHDHNHLSDAISIASSIHTSGIAEVSSISIISSPCAKFCHTQPALTTTRRRCCSCQNAQFFLDRSKVHRESLASRLSVGTSYLPKGLCISIAVRVTDFNT